MGVILGGLALPHIREDKSMLLEFESNGQATIAWDILNTHIDNNGFITIDELLNLIEKSFRKGIICNYSNYDEFLFGWGKDMISIDTDYNYIVSLTVPSIKDWENAKIKDLVLIETFPDFSMRFEFGSIKSANEALDLLNLYLNAYAVIEYQTLLSLIPSLDHRNVIRDLYLTFANEKNIIWEKSMISFHPGYHNVLTFMKPKTIALPDECPYHGCKLVDGECLPCLHQDELVEKSLVEENHEAALEEEMRKVAAYRSENATLFSSGAIRDSKQGKGRCDLLPASALLRLARHYESGAVKYGDRNWEKGIPISSFVDSGMRHLLKYMAGWEDEDHLWKRSILNFLRLGKKLLVAILEMGTKL